MKETRFKPTEIGMIPEDWEVKKLWAHLQNPVCLPKDECEPIEKELYVNNAS